jgi:hypothetical protein
METAHTHHNQEVLMDTLSIFSITIHRGREVIDREQLPARAFSGVEAHAFARRMVEAHGGFPTVRANVVREDIPAV